MNGLDGHPALQHIPADQTSISPLIEAFARHFDEARKINPEYCIAAETSWERLFPYVHAGYLRQWYPDSPQIVSATFPEFRQTSCITGNTDFALVAACIRFGHIINIEAQNLHGDISDVTLMRDFLNLALKLRRNLWDVLWMSHLIDPADHFKIKADDRIKYCLHESRSNKGKLALALSHYAKEEISAEITFNNKNITSATLCSINEPSRQISLPTTILIPPNDCLVIVIESI